MRAQQEAFLKAMTGGMSGWSAPEPDGSEEAGREGGEELDAIRKQLADLQTQLSKLNK